MKIRGIPEVETFEQWQRKGLDFHSVVADPLFVDTEHDNYMLKENNEKAIEKAVENVANKRPKAKENSMDEGALAAFMQLTENAMKREAQEEQQKTNMKENTTFMRLGIADFAIGIGIGAIAGLIVSSFMR